MRADRTKAIKLRLLGESYLEISQSLGVPKSTLSSWLSGLVISPQAQAKILLRGRRQATQALLKRNVNQTSEAWRRALRIRNQAAAEISTISKRELLFLGTALYWAEGYKRPVMRNGRERTFHIVSLTNSDPLLVKIFIKFLCEYCKVPLQKIKASIRIYEHHNETYLKKFWKGIIGIPEKNFRKTYYGVSKSSQGVRPYNRLPHGVIQITVGDTKLFHRIMGYIEGIKSLV